MKHISPMQKEFWVNKINPKTNNVYTNDEIIYKIRSFRKLNKEYWLERGFNENEALANIKKFQKENSEKFNKKRLNNPLLYTDILTNQIGYWLKRGHTAAEAAKLIKDRQTVFSLDICIKKFGKIKGKKIWDNRQKKWQDTLNKKTKKEKTIINNKKKYNIDSFIKTHQNHGIEEYIKYRCKRGANEIILRDAIEKCFKKYKNYVNLYKIYYNLLHKPNNYKRVSKESLNYFIMLYKILRKIGLKRDDIFWGVRGSNEYMLKTDNRKYYYDFTILPYKIIIEYNGTRYHPSPRLSRKQRKLWKEPHHNRTADEKQNRDEEKIKVAIQNGFDIITIWSDLSFECNIANINNILNKWNIQI